jgi:hypothetical protein
MNQRHNRLLLSILILNIAITSAHYTDNAIFVDQYPEPEVSCLVFVGRFGAIGTVIIRR